MSSSPALRRLVMSDNVLARDPLTHWLRDNPEYIDRVLPVIIRSSLEYERLQRAYPQAARELRRLALQNGRAKLGEYNGQL